MKKYNKILLIAIFSVFLSTGCEDYFGEDANVDPDNPTTATVNVILPQVEARLAYTYGGDFSRFIGINTQYIDGVNRQFVAYQNYLIVGGDCDNMWSNIFVGSLNSNRQLLDIAKEKGFAHYQAIGLLLESFGIMVATDSWGDIPYSDAFKFGDNGLYTPSFDSQEVVYNQIFSNIELARTLISADNGGNAPGKDDLVYNGDMSKWLKFANTLEARGRLHLVNRTGSYNDVIAAIEKGVFDNSDDDFDFKFGTSVTENGPWYQYNEQRGDCAVGANFVSLLTNTSDPRLTTYGAPLTISHPIFTPNQNLNIITYTESEFIKAEAYFASDKAKSFAAFQNGVKSSLAEAQVSEEDADAFLGTLPQDSESLTLDDVLTQKYIGLFSNPEAWSDWRRTGIPVLVPNSGNQIPRRLPYSQAELLSNPNTPKPSSITIFDRVWWDQ
ncbi:MAG: SusD/RagB family nutrient-binding outer membrane lipoprotein [Saprospiraceae bacterium]|nr:SusD/RagB family nutrient-binding outer membrane lipoprotein [Saprospiraceae bacterium]